MNPGPTAQRRNDKNYGNFSLSSTVVFLLSGWIISLILYLQLAMAHETYFKKEACTSFMNINSILPKIDKIRYIAKLTNATVVGLNKTKLNKAVSSSELEIEGYDLVRSDRFQRGGGVACFVKNFISYNQKPNFCFNTESIFIEIFLLKSKPVLIGILFRPPDKYDFANCLERTFSDTNVFESQECYLLGDINLNLQPKDKEIFRHKPVNNINKEITYLTRSYSKFCFTHSLEQIITRPTRIIDQTATLIDCILTNSPDKVSQ